MNLLEETKQGNRVYRLGFPDGMRISFRLLTYGRFMNYWELMQHGTVINEILEDAIFKECVIEHSDIENMYEMRAGVIATVAMVIMMMSGPVNPEAFVQSLEAHRQETNSIHSMIVMTICRAFPAYTPEDLQDLLYPTLMQRFVQAEKMLLECNPPQITEQVRLLSPEEIAQQSKHASGQIDANQLVQQESKEIARAAQGNIAEPQQLTPAQLAQIEKIKELKRRRQR